MAQQLGALRALVKNMKKCAACAAEWADLEAAL